MEYYAATVKTKEILILMQWYNKDEPWKHYVKWNKPDTKGWILYDSTSMKYREYSNSEWEKI